jgi:cysteine desulfurase/selenocysteine lyase
MLIATGGGERKNKRSPKLKPPRGGEKVRAMTSIDWAKVRADFPILAQQVNGKPLLYMDNAASSQKPRAVIAALVHYYEHDNANVHRGLHELSSRATDAYEGARKKVARYLGAESEEEIVFTRGTTEGINLVANTWGVANLCAGDVILLTEMEHHSNLIPWQMLTAKTGATLRFVPVADDGSLAFDPALLDGVKLFAFVHVSNSLGTVNPAAELCRAARAAGAVALVDGAQSAGHMPVNVRDIGCDFYVFSGHKICAPTGIGALWGRRELLGKMPPWHGGGEMIVSVTYERATYKQPPHKFEAGTPNIAGAIGLGAAIDYLEAIGRQNIFDHDAALTARAVAHLEGIPGVRILGPKTQRGALAAFHAEWAHPHDLTTYANEHGLALRGGHHCTQPLMRKLKLSGTTRASFYFYNTLDEVDRMGEILRDAHKFFDR